MCEHSSVKAVLLVFYLLKKSFQYFLLATWEKRLIISMSSGQVMWKFSHGYWTGRFTIRPSSFISLREVNWRPQFYPPGWVHFTSLPLSPLVMTQLPESQHYNVGHYFVHLFDLDWNHWTGLWWSPGSMIFTFFNLEIHMSVGCFTC